MNEHGAIGFLMGESQRKQAQCPKTELNNIRERNGIVFIVISYLPPR